MAKRKLETAASEAEEKLAALRRLAAQCDEHAAALGAAIKELHSAITQTRICNGGRGPSGLMVSSR